MKRTAATGTGATATDATGTRVQRGGAMTRASQLGTSLLWCCACIALAATILTVDPSLARRPDWQQDPTAPGVTPDPGGPPPGDGGDVDADELGTYVTAPPSRDRLGSSQQNRSGERGLPGTNAEPDSHGWTTDRALIWIWKVVLTTF